MGTGIVGRVERAIDIEQCHEDPLYLRRDTGTGRDVINFRDRDETTHRQLHAPNDRDVTSKRGRIGRRQLTA